MSQQEAPAIDMFDAPEKPVDLSKFTGGEPDGQPSKAFGLPTDTPSPDEGTAPEKPTEDPKPEAIDDPNAKKLVDKYSAKIQETAEELYASMLYRARNEEGYLAKLAASQDPTEKKLVKKILERNPEFGASSPEEYRLLTEKQQAKDPEAQERIELKHKLNSQDQKLKELEWDKYKEKNGITGDFEVLVDDLHSQHPELPEGKLVAMAKGLSGGTASPQTKQGASFATGGSNPAQTEDAFTSPLARRLLKDVSATKKFAKEYFGSF